MHGTEDDARAYRAGLLAGQAAQPTLAPAGRITLAALMPVWLAADHPWKPSTLVGYRSVARALIADPIGEVRLEALTPGASVTSLVDTLERRGLVTRTRDKTDRRIVLVGLTTEGRTTVDSFLPEVTALHAAEFSVLDDAEREQLVILLAKVAAAIERLDVDAVASSARPRRK